MIYHDDIAPSRNHPARRAVVDEANVWFEEFRLHCGLLIQPGEVNRLTWEQARDFQLMQEAVKGWLLKMEESTSQALANRYSQSYSKQKADAK